MDFLSWQTLNPSSTCDTIILNSLALLTRIQEKIKGYKQVESFLDNDDAGRKSFEVLKHFCPSIIDGSVRYQTHKDLNEWLVSLSKVQENQPLLPEGVSKLIHPLFILPLPCLPHNSLFTAAMLLISYKMIYRALNSLYKLV